MVLKSILENKYLMEKKKTLKQTKMRVKKKAHANTNKMRCFKNIFLGSRSRYEDAHT